MSNNMKDFAKILFFSILAFVYLILTRKGASIGAYVFTFILFITTEFVITLIKMKRKKDGKLPETESFIKKYFTNFLYWILIFSYIMLSMVIFYHKLFPLKVYIFLICALAFYALLFTLKDCREQKKKSKKII